MQFMSAEVNFTRRPLFGTLLGLGETQHVQKLNATPYTLGSSRLVLREHCTFFAVVAFSLLGLVRNTLFLSILVASFAS